MIESDIELIDRVWSEGVAHLGTIEGHSHGTDLSGAVIGDVREVESGNLVPG
jgi:hypothetical protein